MRGLLRGTKRLSLARSFDCVFVLFESLGKPPCSLTNDIARISDYRCTRKEDIYTAHRAPPCALKPREISCSKFEFRDCVYKMSTTRLSIYDLLRITYTYECQALEQAARIRRDSSCSVRRLHVYPSKAVLTIPQTPESCSHISPPSPSGNFSGLETDFTQQFCRKSSR